MKKQISCLLIVVSILISLFAASNITANASVSTVTVAYIEDSPILYQEHGEFKGYAVDYFESVSTYARWFVKFVKLDYETALKELEKEKIDFVIAFPKSNEFPKNVIYSKLPLLTCDTLCYVSSENDSIEYNEIEKLAFADVAINEFCLYDVLFDEYMRGKDVPYTRLNYSSTNACHDAVINGEADAFICSSICHFPDCKLISSFNGIGYYIISTSSREYRMNLLDEAVDNLISNDPSFFSFLKKNYIDDTPISFAPLFTSKDKEYLSSTTSINIGISESSYPLCDFNKNKGIYIDYLNRISELTGIHFKPVPIDYSKDCYESFSDDIPIIMGVGLNDLLIQDTYFDYTKPFYNATSVIVRDGKTLNSPSNHVAVPKSDSYTIRLLSKQRPYNSISYLKNIDECFACVVDGSVDYSVINAIYVDYYIQRPEFNSLMIDTSKSYSIPIVFAKRSSTHSETISILNKCIDYLEREKYIDSLIQAVRFERYQLSFFDYMKKYLTTILLCLFILVIIAFVFLFVYEYRKKMRQMAHTLRTLKVKSEYDELTGLANYNTFIERCGKIIHSGLKGAFALVTIDIEHFNVVNDVYGYEEAKKLIRFISSCITEIIEPPYESASRISNDRFIALVATNRQPEVLFGDAFQEKLHTYSLDNMISTCIGIYYVRDMDLPIYQMCERAGIASSSIRGKYLNRVAVFSDDLRNKMQQEHKITQDAIEALKNSEFEMYLQPTVCISTKKTISAEALVRWNHPEKGYISPGLFIPILEENGFITKLDLYMIEEACRTLQKWIKRGKPVIPISVNLSRKDFFIPSLVSDIRGIAAKYEIPHEYLQFEITENAYFDEHRIISEQLMELHRDSFKVILDDFGCEYTSLNVLKNLPIDMLKLDIRFLTKSDVYNRSNKIITAIVNLMNDLNIDLIAEGIETVQQIDFLKEISCTKAQGFYFSKPVSIFEFEKLSTGDILR